MDDLEHFLDALAFRYIVPHDPSALMDVSPFQMISPGISQTSGAFRLIARLPVGAPDLVGDRDALVAGRMTGQGLVVVPIQLPDFRSALEFFADRILIVFSMTRGIALAAADVIRTVEYPILHVTPDSREVNRQILHEHCLKVAAYWSRLPTHVGLADVLRDGLTEWKDRLTHQPLPFQDKNHFVTEPNIAALAAVGLTPEPWSGSPLGSATNEPYFAAIRESIEPIAQLRKEVGDRARNLLARSRTDLILTVPGVTKVWSELRRKGKIPHVSGRQGKIISAMLRQVSARETYSFQIESTHLEEAVGASICAGIMAANRDDLDVYTAVLGVRASSCFAPVIRLPPSPNGARPELEQLASARRSYDGGKFHKINRLARRLSERLTRGVPSWVVQELRTAGRIKLISDAPLEWMDIDGFPLMLRADVSRIPVTPGNLFVLQSLINRERYIEAPAFQDVLVLRSFKHDDKLRATLQWAIEMFTRDSSKYPTVRFVDVRTRDDIVRALNGFSGAILIYDGHGSHPEHSDVGELVLVDERLDPWTLRGLARIPPIVILSACDTHPFDASHATVANGFLNAGAMTVVGTSVPVGGFESAVLVARLLLRVGMVLPILLKRPWSSFRWSEVLPGMQRRQFVTEALHRLSALGGLPVPDETMAEISMDVGMHIDRGEEWLAVFVEHIAKLAETSTVLAKELLLKHAAFVDALAYTQLGNPELIVGLPTPAQK